MLDKLGQEITVGAYIAYGHALGRCAGLRIGKVLGVSTQGKSVYGTDYVRKGYAITSDLKDEAESLIPTSGICITVRGVDDDWLSREPELASRNGTLMFPNRIIVLDAAKVPETYKKLLEGIS